MNTSNETFLTCFAMNVIVDKGVFGPVAHMNYLLSDIWQHDMALFVLSIIMCIVVGFIFVLSLFGFVVIKIVNNRRSIADLLVILFNFSNALIFIVLSQIGWTVPTFFIAACHNSIELVIIIVLMKKYFPGFFPSKRIYNALIYVIVIIGVGFTLPHLILH